MLEDAEEGKKLVAPKTRGRGVGCVLHDRCPDSGTAPDGGVGHPFPTFCLGLVRASRRVRPPRGAGCGCHSFALHGSRRLAARHPATTRLLIENCELIAAWG